MSIYQIFIINRAGSLIFDWENKQDEPAPVEKNFEYPLSIVLELIDQKPTVVFGQCDNIFLRYIVTFVNGRPLKGHRFTIDVENTITEMNFMDFIENKENFPLKLTFSPPILTANEKIILSSMFHSLYTIAAQLSPVAKSSGIEVLETNQFRLHCFQSLTGIKFIVVAANSLTQNLGTFLRKIYELYADYALKNPFYSIDMPIRAEKFEEALKGLLEKQEKTALTTL